MEFSLRTFFQDFNASKFVVYLSVLVFSVLFSLRIDKTINLSYVFIFFPLLFWKIIVFFGAIIGCLSHNKRPPSRNDTVSEIEFRGMLVSTGEHFFLFIFELLACYKLEIENVLDVKDLPKSPMWIVVFIPLLFECTISIVICIWSVRQDRSIEFELFFSFNWLQFVFLPLKLDKIVDWNWAVVFIPLWILICLSLIGVLYAVILAVLMQRSIDLLAEHRRQHIYSAVGYTFLVIPTLIFLMLITGKLDSIEINRDDEAARMPFTIVCAPLFVSLLCLMLMSVGSKSGNQWWFGMRRDFCIFLLDQCPCLQEYGNVSYKCGRSRRNITVEMAPRTIPEPQPVATSRIADFRSIPPPISIDCPD